MNAARLLVCYGGTFDPVHEGHLAVARSARDALDADVALVPARDPPHKGPTRADAAQRARMLELAVAGEAGLSVDLRELHREGPSYTFASLGELRAAARGRGVAGGRQRVVEQACRQVERRHRSRRPQLHRLAGEAA